MKNRFVYISLGIIFWFLLLFLTLIFVEFIESYDFSSFRKEPTSEKVYLYIAVFCPLVYVILTTTLRMSAGYKTKPWMWLVSLLLVITPLMVIYWSPQLQGFIASHRPWIHIDTGSYLTDASMSYYAILIVFIFVNFIASYESKGMVKS